MHRSSFLPDPRRTLAALAAGGLAAAAVPVAVHAAGVNQTPDEAAEICAPVKAGEQCGPGNGRRTSGGGAKVTHAGWPAVTGVLWKVLDSGDHQKVGGDANDELLGHHGSDRIDGGEGDDILWGDWDPANNNGRQRDVLVGGPGDDFIYPSHGSTRVTAGAGRDFIWAYYGHGTIDCGPGQDTARVRMNGAFKLKRCEKVLHW
jgi:Ca2+-binding RTX toxin-like protein